MELCSKANLSGGACLNKGCLLSWLTSESRIVILVSHIDNGGTATERYLNIPSLGSQPLWLMTSVAAILDIDCCVRCSLS